MKPMARVPPSPTPNSACRLRWQVLFGPTLLGCDCRTPPATSCPLSALTRRSWWKAGPRCVARGTAQFLKAPSTLKVWPGNSSPSSYPVVQSMIAEAGSQVQGGTKRPLSSKPHCLVPVPAVCLLSGISVFTWFSCDGSRKCINGNGT